MGKISMVAAKYIVHASIDIDGVVDRPDVIGAIFGQTEGLLGSDLELRELQRSGRIGRIEVSTDTRSGKTHGSIDIPSSLDKAETSIIAAALEIIQRIGPCNAKIKIENIEDVRVSKRKFVIGRAKELLKNLMDNVMPDSQGITDEVASSVRVMEIREYGKDRLPAGPSIDDSDEIIVVEGRADVLNMLKHGIKNTIAMNGTYVPQTIIELSKKKTITVFVDGDRGGDLMVRDLLNVADIDFVSKASLGMEVEELAKKEIHKALRARVAAEQVKMEIPKDNGKEEQERKPAFSRPSPRFIPREKRNYARPQRPAYNAGAAKKAVPTESEKQKFSTMLEGLIGTRGAYILDDKLNILGKVPITELATTVKSLSSGIHAIVFDGIIEKILVEIAERSNIKYLIAMDTKVKPETTKISILTNKDL